VLSDRVYRAFNAEGWRATKSILGTDTMRRRQDAGDVVSCRTLDGSILKKEKIGELIRHKWAAIVEHDRVEFPTFPYEWPRDSSSAPSCCRFERPRRSAYLSTV